MMYDELFEGEMDRVAREREKLNGTGNGNGSHPERYCDCVELLDSLGNRRPCPPFHNCEYVRLRSALVPQAVLVANRRVSVGYGDRVGAAADRWTKVFARELDRLVSAAGLLEATSIGTLDASTHHDNGSNNGSASHNGVQNVEMNGGPVSSGRNTIDATATAIPMW
jgi:hypothetical protein